MSNVTNAKSGAIVDMTPSRVENWLSLNAEQFNGRGPVLHIGLDATLHHRVALAWGMAHELRILAETGVALPDFSVSQDYMSVLWSRLSCLEVLLDSIGGETASELMLSHRRGSGGQSTGAISAGEANRHSGAL